MFFKKKNKITVIKLYSIEHDQVGILRPELTKTILKGFELQFGEIPKNYVIHGPYGIRKGASIGVEAFKNKLNNKDHGKYYSLSGETEGKLGFNISLDATLEKQKYSELIIWWYTDNYSPSFEELVKMVLPYYPISSGFEMQTDDSFDTFSESKIKKGILGGISINISYDHLTWIETYEAGSFRDVFEKNILSESQLKEARMLNKNIHTKRVGKNYFVYSGV
ncbi:MAG: hypothetical protein GJ680_08195 [Alteromonadaceae bacterium]|nr:hypothetical protein [Alteromonadaceae bacterium]